MHPESLVDELETPSLTAAEKNLTKTLLKAFQRPKFSLAAYKDDYVEQLTELIEAKVAGKKIVAAPAAEEPPIINLMEALKKSVAAVQDEEEATPRKKRTTKRTAASAARRKTTTRRRKSG
jgi:DNA end-binding protein Ku